MYDARSAVDGRKWQDGGVITYVISVMELQVLKVQIFYKVQMVHKVQMTHKVWKVHKIHEVHEVDRRKWQDVGT